MARFELAALCSQSKCAARLRYIPSKITRKWSTVEVLPLSQVAYQATPHDLCAPWENGGDGWNRTTMGHLSLSVYSRTPNHTSLRRQKTIEYVTIT